MNPLRESRPHSHNALGSRSFGRPGCCESLIRFPLRLRLHLHRVSQFGPFFRLKSSKSWRSGPAARWVMAVRLDRLRTSTRSWIEEFDNLSLHSAWWRCQRSDWEISRSSLCTVREKMDFRARARRGCLCRVFALCVMCGRWLDFPVAQSRSAFTDAETESRSVPYVSNSCR